jgi:CDP-glucose 4,6-dehydratase
LENLAVSNSFWHGKKVFITGHTGFKGSWLSLYLQSLGAEVTGLSLLPPTQPSLFEAAKVANGMNSLIGDIREPNIIFSALKKSEAEIVIHMAAQSLVRRSYINPVETYATNVMGTVNVLDAVRHCSSVRAVVNVTSDKCYDNKESPEPFIESDPMGGYDPYSNSKGCAELVASAFANSYFNKKNYADHGVALASARAGNVIGGGDWAEDRLLPDIFRAIGHSRPVVVRNPNAIRPWQHVLEPLSGYLLLAENLFVHGSKHTGGWNFGSADQDAKEVGWIVEKICRQWGKGASWLLDEGEHPHEASLLRLSSKKASTLLNWHPRWELNVAIENTVAWQQAYWQGDNMHTFSLNQIANFRKS